MRVRIRLVLAAVVSVGCMGRASADNSTCWGLGSDDKTLPDIACRELTEPFLRSMIGVTRAQVLAAMNAPGRTDSAGSLHFISNYGMGARGFSGFVNFGFDANDKVLLITAVVDRAGGPSNMQFVWNGGNGYLCSNFPHSQKRCE